MTMITARGSDPEFLAKDKDGKAMHFLGVGLKGTKEKPHPVGDGFSIQRDGAALEFCTPVVSTIAEFIAMRNETRERALATTKELLGKDVVLWEDDHAVFDVGTFDEWPDSLIVGCDEDENAYNNAAMPVPGPNWLKRRRIIGGHFHFGHEDMLPSEAIAKLCDLSISAGRVSSREVQPNMRADYQGKFGVFRRKEYGTEYRTPGSSIMFTPDDQLEGFLNNLDLLLDWVKVSPDESLSWYLDTQWHNLQHVATSGSFEANLYSKDILKGTPKTLRDAWYAAPVNNEKDDNNDDYYNEMADIDLEEAEAIPEGEW